MTSAVRRPRPGRPRLIPERSAFSPREEILDSAGRLFTGQGFAATSTREIAEAVGMRQASLYYHFPDGKGAILSELLEQTVRPTLDCLDDLAQLETPEARLYTLAYRDARALADLKHNIGLLPTHPDVASAVACRDYEAARRQLRQAYGALGVACASDAVICTISRDQLGGIIIQQVEGVVRTRAGGHDVTDGELHAVAATCLRLCGVTEDHIQVAAYLGRTHETPGRLTWGFYGARGGS